MMIIIRPGSGGESLPTKQETKFFFFLFSLPDILSFQMERQTRANEVVQRRSFLPGLLHRLLNNKLFFIPSKHYR